MSKEEREKKEWRMEKKKAPHKLSEMFPLCRLVTAAAWLYMRLCFQMGTY